MIESIKSYCTSASLRSRIAALTLTYDMFQILQKNCKMIAEERRQKLTYDLYACAFLLFQGEAQISKQMLKQSWLTHMDHIHQSIAHFFPQYLDLLTQMIHSQHPLNQTAVHSILEFTNQQAERQEQVFGYVQLHLQQAKDISKQRNLIVLLSIFVRNQRGDFDYAAHTELVDLISGMTLDADKRLRIASLDCLKTIIDKCRDAQEILSRTILSFYQKFLDVGESDPIYNLYLRIFKEFSCDASDRISRFLIGLIFQVTASTAQPRLSAQQLDIILNSSVFFAKNINQYLPRGKGMDILMNMLLLRPTESSESALLQAGQQKDQV